MSDAKTKLSLFDPTCPAGAKWYACPATSSNPSPFVGCCASDPCSSSTGCSQGNLRPVSFNASSYGIVSDASCGAASNFWSCVGQGNATTFWGCCKSNPCKPQSECPNGDLTPAVLDTPSLRSQFGVGDGQEEQERPKEGGKSNTAVIAGAAAGGAVVVVAIIAILIFCLCKKKRAKKARHESVPSSADGAAAFAAKEKNAYRGSTVPDGMSFTPPHPILFFSSVLVYLLTCNTAPPMYSSPVPNTNTFSLSPAAAYGGYQQVAQSPAPQELPADFTQGSSQSYSELPSDGPSIAPAELESPVPSPRRTQPPKRVRSPLSPKK